MSLGNGWPFRFGISRFFNSARWYSIKWGENGAAAAIPADLGEGGGDPLLLFIVNRAEAGHLHRTGLICILARPRLLTLLLSLKFQPVVIDSFIDDLWKEDRNPMPLQWNSNWNQKRDQFESNLSGWVIRPRPSLIGRRPRRQKHFKSK